MKIRLIKVLLLALAALCALVMLVTYWRTAVIPGVWVTAQYGSEQTVSARAEEEAYEDLSS